MEVVTGTEEPQRRVPNRRRRDNPVNGEWVGETKKVFKQREKGVDSNGGEGPPKYSIHKTVTDRETPKVLPCPTYTHGPDGQTRLRGGWTYKGQWVTKS